MKIHDCTKCESTERCPIKDMAPWLNEHMEETDKAVSDQKHLIAMACTGFVESFPPAIVCYGEVGHLAMSSFLLGYHKGRAFPVVPKVYEET